MDTKLLRELQTVIDKNLPAIQADRLKEILTENETLNDLRELLDQKQQRIDHLEEILSPLQKKETELDILIEETKAEKEAQEKKILNIKLEQAERRADEIKGLVQTVFGNKMYTSKTINTNNYGDNVNTHEDVISESQ